MPPGNSEASLAASTLYRPQLCAVFRVLSCQGIWPPWHTDSSENTSLLITRNYEESNMPFFPGATAPSGPGPHYWDFTITFRHTPHSVGLLWMSDCPDAETSTWQHTTLTTDRHPRPWQDSNPQSQQALGCRPTA